MLTVTHEASKAINTLTDALPDAEHAGLRFSMETAEDGSAQLALSVADGPAPDDQVVESDDGATVYVAEPVAEFMDDKTLDAEIQGEGVAFSITDQGEPPS